MREVVKKEVLKLLHASIIYPVQDSEWVSPVQVVLKMGGMRVVWNKRNESYLSGQSPAREYVSITRCSTKLPGKITSLCPSSMRCLNGWQSTHTFATSMDTLVIIKFQSILMTRVRLPSPAPMEHSPIGECRLVFAMHRLSFKGA